MNYVKRHHAFEDQPEQIAVAELAVAIFREGGMVRNPAIETEPAEPPMRQVQMDLLAEPALGPEAGQIGAYEILDRLRAEGLGSKPPGAYRALNFLTANGLAHRLERLNA